MKRTSFLGVSSKRSCLCYGNYEFFFFFFNVYECFWLENMFKYIQPVHPKGNQSWIFTGRTDVEAETSTSATWCKDLTHLKRPWCWERLKAGEEGDNRGWDGWMASPTQWTWVWVNSRSWWWTGRPGVLQSMGSQRVWYNWVTELNWYQIIDFILNDTIEYLSFCVWLQRTISWSIHIAANGIMSFLFWGLSSISCVRVEIYTYLNRIHLLYAFLCWWNI